MLETLDAIFASIIAFFNGIDHFLNTAIYDILTWAFAQFIEASTIAFIDFVMWATPFAWNVAKQIIVDLNLSTLLDSAWGAMPSDLQGVATLLKIPESVNLLISAYFTRFVLKYIPFI
ncbi:DUF2523 family protein [Methylobacter sp. sgz302048]|uniref:DUF2523 family protein n=1 Tax=Methylobacter sp. sgz302048 TaxID=3455945 RepID=UPI003FA0CD42